ncbi:MAG: electron transfer flavoprotein subunit alpha/FixB family protein [Chloroflexota bacterium]
MADYQGVLAYCEAGEGKLTAIATEALGAGRKLAKELGTPLSALLVGSGTSALAKEAIAYGADRVFIVDDPLLKDYQTDAYVTATEKAAKQAMPQIIILGQTAIGRDLAPRLAFRLETTATLDCIELAIDPASKRLLQTKPVYGGNAQAVFTSNTDPQIVTVRMKAFTPLARDDRRPGETIKVETGLDAAVIKTRVVDKVKEKVEGIKLEDAPVLVVGGRGIGSAENFQPLQELAKVLKGTIGASRPPCDNGWVPAGLQIGLTGKIVAPELYIAIALSGSSQHMSGCSGCKTIVAINKDPEANIIKRARYAVVGDWKKVLPAFTAKVKELTTG